MSLTHDFEALNLLQTVPLGDASKLIVDGGELLNEEGDVSFLHSFVLHKKARQLRVDAVSDFGSSAIQVLDSHPMSGSLAINRGLIALKQDLFRQDDLLAENLVVVRVAT